MNQNLLKGMLVLLVVLDHNEYARSVLPHLLDAFSFHVVGFLTVPFLRPASGWSKAFVNYLFRLYFPFFVIMSLMAILVAWLTPVTAAEQTRLWLHAVYSGNSSVLHQLTQMALLWFLPSLVALVILRTTIEHSKPAIKVGLLALLCLAHPLVGTCARQLENYLPLGLLPAVYVLPLAYIGVFLHRKLFAEMRPALALLLTTTVAVAIKYLQMRAGLYAEIGFAQVADYQQPYALLINDLESLSGVLMMFQLARFRLGRFLELCGEYSLQIYLFHAFVALIVYKILQHFAASWPLALLLAVSMLVTAALSAVLARFLARQALLRRWLFPRSPAELLGRASSPHLQREPLVSSRASQSDARP